MTARTMIFAAMACSGLLTVGVLIAFFWSEWRGRTWERWFHRLRARPLAGSGASLAPADGAELRVIPIPHRPFHEAVREDESSLAPTPRTCAIAQELAERQRKSEVENDEMKWRQMVAAAALTAGTLSACAQTPRPQPKHNPHPRQRYEITMTIANAPGPFASIVGTAQYDTVNYNECGLRDEGTHLFHELSGDVPITFTKVSESQYIATVYMDLMHDEDYHGRGVCRWKLTDVRAELKATGMETDTAFVPSTSPEAMLDGRAVTVYFNKHWYPRDPHPEHADINFPDFGQKDRSRFGPSIADADLFAITLTPKAVTQ